MSQTFRHPDILKIAQREGKVTVESLADHFGVTLQTIRRDLTELAEANKLERVHGGAILPSGTTNIEYDERRNLNQASKLAMARACARHIPEGCSIFMNIGTSTEAVARELLEHRDLMVVTNNMNIANILIDNSDCQIVVTGGTLRRSDSGLVGKITTDTIQQFKFDIAVIGCSALDEDGDLLDFDIQEVGVSQSIIAHARQCFLVADHSKFNRTAPARIASMRDLSAVFSDQPLPEPLMDCCARWKTQVVIAD